MFLVCDLHRMRQHDSLLLGGCISRIDRRHRKGKELAAVILAEIRLDGRHRGGTGFRSFGHHGWQSARTRRENVRLFDATTFGENTKEFRAGQGFLRNTALSGNPDDGHTLAKVIPDIAEKLGVSLKRVIADAGYRGHNAPKTKGLRVYTSGQKRGVADQIKRELRRRSAVEPVIGHLKEDHRMDRNFLAGKHGDAANAVLAAASYNFNLIVRWLDELLCALLAIATYQLPSSPAPYGVA